MSPDEKYRIWLNAIYPDLLYFESGKDVPQDCTEAHLARKGNSHRGIARCTALTVLQASAPNQDFLDEIALLENLEYLELSWPVTASDLMPLKRLRKLRTLKIDSPRNVSDFAPLCELPELERLLIENAKHLRSLEWLCPLVPQLKVLGVEGSLYTTQVIESLAPLAVAQLEALFLTNVKLEDQDLSPIAGMPNIRYLGCGIIAPRAEFLTLRSAKPDLECQWFDIENWREFRDPKPPGNKRG